MLEDVDLQTRERMWIQLDGAPPHYAVVVRTFLNNPYPRRWTERDGPISWHLRSPDLTPLEFFWRFLKNAVYKEKPTTKHNMKNRIREACASIPRKYFWKLSRAFRNEQIFVSKLTVVFLNNYFDNMTAEILFD